MLHTDEPLQAQARLDRHIGTLGITDLVGVVLDFLHQTECLQVFDNLLAAVETIHTVVLGNGRTELRLDGIHIQVRIGREDVDGAEVVFLPQCIVVDIVCRRYFQAARTETDLHIAVFDNRNNTPHARHDDMLAAQPLVLLLLWVDADCYIAEDSLGASGGNDGVVRPRLGVCHTRLCHLVAQVVELAMLLVVDDLLIAQGSLPLGVPIDHTQAAVDKSFLIEVAEYMDNGTRAGLVHRERSTIPVARAAEFAQLLEDNASVFVRPIPRMLQELLTRQVGLVNALLFQSLDDFRLRGNRSVVCTRHPAGVLALQAGTTHKNVLNSLIQHMPHVQHACHIRWGNNDRKRLTTIRFAMKEFVV